VIVSATKPSDGTPNHWPQASFSTATQFEIKWFDGDDTSAHVEAVDTQMDCQVILMGYYS
jgi:hypothetical protein